MIAAAGLVCEEARTINKEEKGFSSSQSIQDCIYALEKTYLHSPHLIRSFSLRSFETSFSVRLTDDGPFSSFQERWSRAFFLSTALLQAIDGVMSLGLYLQVVSQAPQHFRSHETQANCDGCFCSPVYLLGHFLLTRVHAEQYIHRNFRRWMSNIDKCQSGFPVPLFTFGSKLNDSVGDNGMRGLTVTSQGKSRGKA